MLSLENNVILNVVQRIDSDLFILISNIFVLHFDFIGAFLTVFLLMNCEKHATV